MASALEPSALSSELENAEAGQRSPYSAAPQSADSDVEETPSGKTTYFPSFLAAATFVLVLAGLVTSAGAMVFSQSITVYVMGGVCIVNCVAATAKQYTLVRYGGMRQMLNNMRAQVNLLQDGVQKLQVTVDGLQRDADSLRDAEQKLDDIAREQGMNCNDLVSLIKENEAILKQMKINLRQDAMADITEIVLMSDRSGDMKIDMSELNQLTLRAQMQLSPHGIDLDQEKFKAMVSRDNDIRRVVKVIAAILFKEEMDGADVDDDDSQDTHQEMFSVQEKFNRGSADAARGAKPSLSKPKTGRAQRARAMMQRMEDQSASLDLC